MFADFLFSNQPPDVIYKYQQLYSLNAKIVQRYKKVISLNHYVGKN